MLVIFRLILAILMSLTVSTKTLATVKWNHPSTNSGKPSVKFPFIPDEINFQFKELSKQHKMQACGFQNYTPKWHEIDRDLAQKINSNPLIYYPDGLKAAAIRFKNSLQENAKTHASIEDVIEASHNSISTWENENKFKPVIMITYPVKKDEIDSLIDILSNSDIVSSEPLHMPILVKG